MVCGGGDMKRLEQLFPSGRSRTSEAIFSCLVFFIYVMFPGVVSSMGLCMVYMVWGGQVA